MNSRTIKMIRIACAALLFTAGVAMAQPPTIAKTFNPTTIPVGGTTSLVFTIGAPGVALTNISFTDVLPPGLSIKSTLNSNCPGGGTVIAIPGTTSIAVTLNSLGPAATCFIQFLVNGNVPGVYSNSVVVSDARAGVGNTSTAVLTVAAPPAISKAFGAPAININGITTLTFTLLNPNPTVPMTFAGFSDTLPTGLVVANPPAVVNTCGGTLTADNNTSLIQLTGATIPAAAACTVTVTVFGVSNGVQNNTTNPVFSLEGGAGNTASAAITVTSIIDPEQAFQVRYASNLNVGDSVIDLTNTGNLSLPSGLTTTGNLCVNVYTFDANEELISCCSCLVTPNGLNSLSAKTDLVSNTLTPGVPTSIVIKLVASRPLGVSPTGTGGTCNPSSPTPLTVSPGLRAWGTTLHALPTTPVTYGLTETRFDTAPLSVAELTKLTLFCGFIQANGSGFGICKSCRTGGLGAISK
jgi:hypothetical protein